MSKAQITITRQIETDDCRDCSYLDQEGWEDRLAQFNRGEFHFVGVRAVATIALPYGKDWIRTTITSPGLWGIESDSGDSYFQEVFQEERKTLLGMLEHLKDYEIVA